MSLDRLAYLIIRGVFPSNINVSKEECTELAKAYIENILKTDLRRLDGEIDYNEHKAKLILKSLNRNESTTVSNRAILHDIIKNDEQSISKNSLVKYLDVFDRMFFI